MGNKSTSGKVSTSDKYLAKYLICIQTIPAHPNFRFRTEFDLRLDWYQTLGLCSQQTGLAEPGYEVGLAEPEYELGPGLGLAELSLGTRLAWVRAWPD